MRNWYKNYIGLWKLTLILKLLQIEEVLDL
jgi:hypothetical protein